ncbi:MAG: hypothetical protein ABF792_08840 [Bifidobacterium psychraerophilum]|uniref:hypothetical protein n=1 Tax=Bifidobacterium psychraerophilum TaxID=218140 RepID=UPI0039E93789
MVTDPLHRDTVTFTLPGKPVMNQDGEPSTTASTVRVPGCNVQPVVAMGDDTFLAQVTQNRYRLNSPPGVHLSELGITPDSIATWRGNDYSISGEIGEWYPGDGMLEHSEIYLVRGGG